MTDCCGDPEGLREDQIGEIKSQIQDLIVKALDKQSFKVDDEHFLLLAGVDSQDIDTIVVETVSFNYYGLDLSLTLTED